MTTLATSGAALVLMGDHAPAFLVNWLARDAAFMVRALDRLPPLERVARLVEVARDDHGHVVMAVGLATALALPVMRSYADSEGTEHLPHLVWAALWERLPEAWREAWANEGTMP